MHDVHKNKEYFDQFITYQDIRISKFEHAVSDAEKNTPENISGIQSALNTIFTFALQRLIAMYSRGDSSDDISSYFDSVEENFYNSTTFSYTDILWFVSIAVVLNKDLDAIYKKTIETDNSDQLLVWLLGKPDWQDHAVPPQRYELLATAIRRETLSKSDMEKYLASWYSSNTDAYWYDSHNSKKDIYFGYWAFEVAAIAKRLRLNEHVGSDFFPNGL